MKLLIYTEYFLPIPGGVQTIVLELARGLAAWKPREPSADLIEVTVVTRTKDRAEYDERFSFQLVRRPRFRKLVQLIKAADVVHLAGPAMLPLALSLTLRKPVVVEHHGFQAACPNGLLFFGLSQAPCPGYFMARRYDKCVECNQGEIGMRKSLYWLLLTHVRRWLTNRAINITPTAWLSKVLMLNQMRTIHHGILQPESKPPEKPPLPTFAYQGRLVTAKGVNVLLEAVERLAQEKREFTVKIIGEGEQGARLRARAVAGSNHHVKFLGHLPNEKLEEALSSVETVVMPSLGGEVFGLVAAENMMRGKLLIASDIGALEEVLGGTGLVFPAGNVAGLVQRMRQVLDNPTLATFLGAAGRERAIQAFERDSMIEKHVLLYREALSR